MILRYLTALFVLAQKIWTLADVALEARAKCPLTEANVYRYGCAQKGWVQTPSYLKIIKNVSALYNCAKQCHAATSCKSFRFVKTTKKCYLYDTYLNGMMFTTVNYQEGIFYERECFTTDCKTIKACDNLDACPYPYYSNYVFDGGGYVYFDYLNFACDYGVMANLDRFSHRTNLLESGLTTCEALNDCAGSASAGPFVIGYHLPSGRWICTSFTNIDRYNYYPSLHDNYVNDMTLTKKNSSIGASYGYWNYEKYNPDRR